MFSRTYIIPSQLLLLYLTLCYTYLIHIPNYSDRRLSKNINNYYYKIHHGPKAFNNVPTKQATELTRIGSAVDITNLDNPLKNKLGLTDKGFLEHVMQVRKSVSFGKASELDLLFDKAALQEKMEAPNEKYIKRFRGKRSTKKKQNEGKNLIIICKFYKLNIVIFVVVKANGMHRVYKLTIFCNG